MNHNSDNCRVGTLRIPPVNKCKLDYTRIPFEMNVVPSSTARITQDNIEKNQIRYIIIIIDMWHQTTQTYVDDNTC